VIKVSPEEQGISSMKRSWGAREAKIVAARQQWRCATCRELLPSTFELDHVVALHLGGSDDYETNAEAKCPGCHAAKTQMEMIELTRLRQQAKRAAIEERMRAIKKAKEDQPLDTRLPDLPTPTSPFPPSQPPMPGDADFVDDLTVDNPFLRFAYDGPVGYREEWMRAR